MKTYLPGILGSLALAGTIATAFSQDFYENERPGPAYFQFDAGGLLLRDFRLTSFGGVGLDGTKASCEPGYRVDAIGGYRFCRDLSVELNVGVGWNRVDKIGGVSVSPDHFDLWQAPLLVDLVYTLPIHGPVSVFVGGGAGGVFTSIDYHVSGFGHIEDTDAAFGYQGLAGVNYAINDYMDVGVSYRFLGTSNHSWSDRGVDITAGQFLSHAILATFTVKF